MRLPWRKSKQDPTQGKAPTAAPVRSGSSFDGDLEDFTVLRHHAIRALSGVLMDRHSACKSPHPFCGSPGHRRNGDDRIELIAEAIPQSAGMKDEADLIGIYLCHAQGYIQDGGETQDIMQYITSMMPSQLVPNRKLVVSAPENGIYPVNYGPNLNPVEGDYSTGSIDPENVRTFRSNPEPNHCRWQYWRSELDQGDWLVPRFHCLQVFGEWWIVEVDRVRGVAQQVAALDFADSPEHSFGVHSG